MADGLRPLYSHVVASRTSQHPAGIREEDMRGPQHHSPSFRLDGFSTDEGAARFYLREALDRDDRVEMRGITAPDRPQLVPDLKLRVAVDTAELMPNIRTVQFEQTKNSIPIFGSSAVVDMEPDRRLLGISAHLANPTDIPPIARISAADALNSIERETGARLSGSAKAPDLTFYFDSKHSAWYLAYLFKELAAAPPGTFDTAQSHGLGCGLQRRNPLFNYLVDAHTGDLLLMYSAVAMAMPLPVPTTLTGVAEDDVSVEFWGRTDGPQRFELYDPLTKVRTYTLGQGDIENPPSPTLVSGPTRRFTESPGAVSAHANAMRVCNFYRTYLRRVGVDGNGMDLVSYVDCTAPKDEPPPQWRNAVWWKGGMWYGQVYDNGKLRSMARYLDIIAHELAHGVTEFTAGLIYRDQSGALNESFSDIFAILIKNWTWNDTDPIAPLPTEQWNWEVGSDFFGSGKPLRDLSDPRRTNSPDHMSQYRPILDDYGGVHMYSNIHNKAAHNVLTIKDGADRYLFSAKDVAVLYYLCLTRLNRIATFKDALQALLSVAMTYYADDARVAERIAGLTDAYARVGIGPPP